MSGNVPTRSTITRTTTVVRHVARPMGQTCENGPHLYDLRKFVEACRDLPDDALVRIENGYLSESGRRDVTLRVDYQHPTEDKP